MVPPGYQTSSLSDILLRIKWLWLRNGATCFKCIVDKTKLCWWTNSGTLFLHVSWNNITLNTIFASLLLQALFQQQQHQSILSIYSGLWTWGVEAFCILTDKRTHTYRQFNVSSSHDLQLLDCDRKPKQMQGEHEDKGWGTNLWLWSNSLRYWIIILFFGAKAHSQLVRVIVLQNMWPHHKSRSLVCRLYL